MSLLQELETAVDFYYQLHQHDKAIEKAKLAIVTLNKERNHTVKKAGKKAWPVVLSITILFSALSIIASIGFIFRSASLPTGAELLVELAVTAAIFLLVNLMGLMISLAYKAFICNPVTKKRRAQAESEWQRSNNNRYLTAKENVERFIERKQNFYSENVGVLDFIPAAYRDEESIQYMYRYVRDNRADTLKEAINLYEEFKQNEKIRNEIRRNTLEQEEIKRTLREIKRYAEEPAEYNNYYRR